MVKHPRSLWVARNAHQSPECFRRTHLARHWWVRTSGEGRQGREVSGDYASHAAAFCVNIDASFHQNGRPPDANQAIPTVQHIILSATHSLNASNSSKSPSVDLCRSPPCTRPRPNLHALTDHPTPLRPRLPHLARNVLVRPTRLKRALLRCAP